MRSQLRYFAAVLSGPAVRIWLLTCGAEGARTPDPLLANNGQTVDPRPYPQVTFPLPRPSKAIRICTCCGTSVLYAEACHGTVPRGTTHCIGWPVTRAIRSKSLS
jgi:hypothetical protein